MPNRSPLSLAAAVIFIAEGIAILLFPDRTITAFCRRHPWLWEVAEGLLDIHRSSL